MNTTILYAYHPETRSLVMPHPTDVKQAFAIPVAALRAAGWNIDEETSRRALPRFDPGPKLSLDGDVVKARQEAQMRRALESAVKNGRR